MAIGRHGRVDYVFADRPGVLTAAPNSGQLAWSDAVTLGHQRLREVGVAAELTGTNRDYLAAVYAVGPDVRAGHNAVERYRATRRWVIEQPGAAAAAPASA